MGLCSIDGDGFHRATRQEIRTFLEANYRGIFPEMGAATPESAEGQWLDRLTGDVSDILDVLGQVHAMRSPSKAIGAGLARVVRINGVTKNPPERSTGTVTLTGTTGTKVPAGTRIGNAEHEDAIFETVADVAIDGATDVAVRSTVTGPVPGDVGELSVPMTVISGWSGVSNAAAVSLGNAGETDGELRARRAISVAINSQGIVDGLHAHLLQLPDVTEAIVRENPEDTVQTLADGGTLAPHAIHCIVRGGLPSDIAAAIALRRAAGCTTVGAIEEAVTDAQGVARTMRFDRPTDLPVYVNIHTPAALTADEEAVVRKAIVARGYGRLVFSDTAFPGSRIGEDVALSDLWATITALQFSTMPTLKVRDIDIGTSPAPSGGAAITVAYNQVAAWDEDNITFEVDP